MNLKNIEKIDEYWTTTKVHKAQPMCIIHGMYRASVPKSCCRLPGSGQLGLVCKYWGHISPHNHEIRQKTYMWSASANEICHSLEETILTQTVLMKRSMLRVNNSQLFIARYNISFCMCSDSEKGTTQQTRSSVIKQTWHISSVRFCYYFSNFLWPKW